MYGATAKGTTALENSSVVSYKIGHIVMTIQCSNPRSQYYCQNLEATQNIFVLVNTQQIPCVSSDLAM